MKNFLLIKSYLIIWAVYFTIIALLPASYINGEYYLSILCLLCFISLSSITFFIIYFSYPMKLNRRLSYGIGVSKYLGSIIVYSVIFSIISVTFIIYDRVIIQGIDYSKGLAFAREQWRVIGESRSGVSSIFSLVGNLFSGFPIVLTALLYLYYDELKKKLRFVAFFTAIATVGLSTFLTGGRSIIMMFLVSLFLIALLRKSRGIGYKPKAISFFVLMFFVLIIAASFIYTVYVFHLRAIAGGNSSASYMLSTLKHLGMMYTGENLNILTFVDNVSNYLTIVGAYLVHSVWTLQSILDLNNYEGFVTFNFYRANLARIWDINSGMKWEFSGLFSTYLGAFYYDYGVVGAIFSSCAIGLLIFISTLVLHCRNMNPLKIGIYLSSMYIVILSPLLFAMDIMSFPFILFDCCLLYLLSLFSRIRIFTLSRSCK